MLRNLKSKFNEDFSSRSTIGVLAPITYFMLQENDITIFGSHSEAFLFSQACRKMAGQAAQATPFPRVSLVLDVKCSGLKTKCFTTLHPHPSRSSSHPSFPLTQTHPFSFSSLSRAGECEFQSSLSICKWRTLACGLAPRRGKEAF